MNVQQIKEQVAEKSELLDRLNAEVRKVIVGQENMVSRLLIVLLTHGHVLTPADVQSMQQVVQQPM